MLWTFLLLCKMLVLRTFPHKGSVFRHPLASSMKTLISWIMGTSAASSRRILHPATSMEALPSRSLLRFLVCRIWMHLLFVFLVSFCTMLKVGFPPRVAWYVWTILAGFPTRGDLVLTNSFLNYPSDMDATCKLFLMI